MVSPSHPTLHLYYSFYTFFRLSPRWKKVVMKLLVKLLYGINKIPICGSNKYDVPFYLFTFPNVDYPIKIKFLKFFDHIFKTYCKIFITKLIHAVLVFFEIRVRTINSLRFSNVKSKLHFTSSRRACKIFEFQQIPGAVVTPSATANMMVD